MISKNNFSKKQSQPDIKPTLKVNIPQGQDFQSQRNSVVKSGTLLTGKSILDRNNLESNLPSPNKVRELLTFNTYFNIDAEYVNLLKEQCKDYKPNEKKLTIVKDIKGYFSKEKQLKTRPK